MTATLSHITADDAERDPAPLDFDTKRAAGLLERIICAACTRPAMKRRGDTGRLCDGCRADVAATRKRLAIARANAEVGLELAQATFDQVLSAADAQDQARYATVVQALADADTDVLLQRVQAGIRKALERGDGLSAILVAKQALDAASDAVQARYAAIETALSEVYAAAAAQLEMGKGEYLIPYGAAVERCKSCGASVVWAQTASGRATPLSLALVEERDGVKVTKTHFIDCPQSREWRRAA